MLTTRTGRGAPPAPMRIARRVAAAAAIAAALGLTASASALSWEMRVCADPNAMPFSRSDAAGFENEIAAVLASELGAELSFLWFPQLPAMFEEYFREGACDVVMGVPDGYEGVLTTVAYYRSPHVFVYRADAGFEVTSLDDAILHDLRIGIQSQLGPINDALLRRGLADNIAISFGDRGGYMDDPDPLAPLVQALIDDEVDVVIPWGAAAGYYANRMEVDLVVNPVRPEFDHPFTPMFLTMVMGVRYGDESFRDRLNVAIANQWDEITAILEQYDVPLLPVTRPRAAGGAP